jgi:hypothetical protein
MVALTELGFTPAQAHTLLTLEPLPVDLFDGLVDASDRLEGGDTILWWNDIEKDARYASFPKSWNAVSRARAHELSSTHAGSLLIASSITPASPADTAWRAAAHAQERF